MPVYKLTSYKEAQQAQDDKVEVPTEAPAKLEEASSKIIQIDGPMSSLFTDALQKVFSKENALMDVVPKAVEEIFGDKKQDAELYVYSSDPADKSIDARTAAINGLSIALGQNKKAVYVVNKPTVEQHMNTILDFCEGAGIRVFFNTQTAAGSIMAMVNAG